MLNLELLTKKEDFEILKKKQLVIIKWKEGSSEHVKGNGVREYRIVDINSRHEIILQKRGNIYFNYVMYLNKMSNRNNQNRVGRHLDYVTHSDSESNVKEVYRVVENE